mmetsp:Transcript_22263/g.88366  ORF Transcript_22263/g.88366 Transcript_22263/m.88366 type:complete len:376 (-) Transcript_22263:1470-2597(-)
MRMSSNAVIIHVGNNTVADNAKHQDCPGKARPPGLDKPVSISQHQEPHIASLQPACALASSMTDAPHIHGSTQSRPDFVRCVNDDSCPAVHAMDRQSRGDCVVARATTQRAAVPSVQSEQHNHHVSEALADTQEETVNVPCCETTQVRGSRDDSALELADCLASLHAPHVEASPIEDCSRSRVHSQDDKLSMPGTSAGCRFLNPNAKEFKFNADAAEWTPSVGEQTLGEPQPPECSRDAFPTTNGSPIVHNRNPSYQQHVRTEVTTQHNTMYITPLIPASSHPPNPIRAAVAAPTIEEWSQTVPHGDDDNLRHVHHANYAFTCTGYTAHAFGMPTYPGTYIPTPRPPGVRKSSSGPSYRQTRQAHNHGSDWRRQR